MTVGATDLARSEAFYTRLGLRVIVRADRYLRFECPDGDGTFSVEAVADVRGDEAVTVYFEDRDVDGVVERMAAGGATVDQLPADMPWRWREARLRDPDGHRICVFWAGRDRHDPPWRVP